jgi:murein DD-endopeptidase MepM/ murein hydrolase activator NlpD
MSADFADLYGGVQSALTDILGGSSRRQQQPQSSAYDAYMQSLYQGPAGGVAPPALLGGYADPAATQALYSGPGGQRGYADSAALYQGPGGQQDAGGALFAGPGQVGSGGFLAQANAGVDAARAQARAEQRGLSGTATEAGDWSGPATADDNKTLDGGKIDAWIAATRPNSPLRGKGGYILQVANQYGVSAPLLMGIFLKESELGTTAGAGFNLAGVGGEGNFAQYGSWEQAIDGAARNLGGPTYKGKSAQDQIGYWFVGKPGDLNATDSTGGRNGTVRDYLDGPVAAAYSGLGVPFNAAGTGTRRAGGGATGGLMGVTGGRGSIMQEFGSTDYAEANPDIYSFAVSMGLRAGQHSGIDLGVPRGTQLFSPVAGTVVIAGNSGFYTDAGGGPGELRIRLDNGDELILGHDSAINVRVGQRVTPGMLVGLSGGSDGDHVHVEFRVRDSSTPSGWRIVDPRTKLGAGTAYTAPIARGRPS